MTPLSICLGGSRWCYSTLL